MKLKPIIILQHHYFAECLRHVHSRTNRTAFRYFGGNHPRASCFWKEIG